MKQLGNLKFITAAKVAISCACFAYTICAFFWSMPEAFPLRPKLVHAVSPIFRFTGLWQGWAMFAPNPLADDIYVTAVATFRDGTTASWNVSRMSEMTYAERYRRERWRKWANDNLRLDSNSNLWPSAGIWFRSWFETKFEKPVEKIELIRHWQPAAIPKSNGEVDPRPDWKHYKFYSNTFSH